MGLFHDPPNVLWNGGGPVPPRNVVSPADGVQQGPIPKCNWLFPSWNYQACARASFTGCCFLKSQLIVLKTGSNSQLLIPPKKMPELVSE